MSALSVSGFDTREFAFYGFLPRQKKELREFAESCGEKNNEKKTSFLKKIFKK